MRIGRPRKSDWYWGYWSGQRLWAHLQASKFRPQSNEHVYHPTLVPALLSVNKFVKAEAEQWLYGHNKFFCEDTAALQAFITPLTSVTRGLLRELVVVKWNHAGRQRAINHSAFCVLAQGGLNLRSFSSEWSNWTPRLAARDLYHYSFPWLEAVARARGVDEALSVLDVSRADQKRTAT